MAITAWSAKVFSSSICLSVNGWTSVRRTAIAPMATPSRSSGTPRMRAVAELPGARAAFRELL